MTFMAFYMPRRVSFHAFATLLSYVFHGVSIAFPSLFIPLLHLGLLRPPAQLRLPPQQHSLIELRVQEQPTRARLGDLQRLQRQASATTPPLGAPFPPSVAAAWPLAGY